MDCIRITADVSFPCDERGEIRAECREAHDALLDALAAARKCAVDVTEREPTKATRHVCRHADGLPCVEDEDVQEGAACVSAARAK